MSKVIKQMEMNALRSTFEHVRDLVVLSAERLSSQGEYTFRSAMRKKGVRLKVVKNSLCRRVFKDLNLQVPDDSPYWEKPTMLAWGGSSIAELSRNIDGELNNPKNAGLYKDKEKKLRVAIKGAIADGSPVPFDQAKTMPTLPELLGQIVAAIIGPGSQLAACLEGPGGQLASQIQQISEKKEGEETPAAPAT
jgi:ribosomal protein L10